MLRPFLLALGIAAAGPALAVGSGDSSAPAPTPTTTECTDGQVYDSESQTCVDAESNLLDDDERYGAVRELAYAGQLENAQRVLATMSDQRADRVLTYWGFTHRKLGNADLGMVYYRQAIDTNPGNLLVRSYMGQHLAETGAIAAARVQLMEIRARGGEGTWPEAALASAIETGRGYSY
ncbi:tetratricopeptide repeat protein [Anianabacter salinae]|uniref:hypothetical protein n=1 Tax=Anianabacter salinae TaxID=2851023 RepID=UPI00225E2377|nr:hypothetical protein [Anianabacter salinae]MBV0912909.1 hypothetical protein [Anianabacter salinae]